MIMPYLFMPAKDPSEVISFFDDLVQDGKLKVINAEDRPDVWARVEPCDDIRLIVGAAETVPPEGTDIARVLDEFRPEPDANTQYNSWAMKPESEEDAGDASIEPVDDKSQELPPADVTLESEPAPVEDNPIEQAHSAMDKPWTSFASRGFKG